MKQKCLWHWNHQLNNLPPLTYPLLCHLFWLLLGFPGSCPWSGAWVFLVIYMIRNIWGGEGRQVLGGERTEPDWQHPVPKKWCFRIVVLEKTLESPLDCKEIQPVHPKGEQPWVFTRRTDAEAEAPIFGHLMWRADSLEKDPDARKDSGQETGATENEMVGWHHWFTGHESAMHSEGQGSLVCCSPWGCKELDTS